MTVSTLPSSHLLRPQRIERVCFPSIHDLPEKKEIWFLPYLLHTYSKLKKDGFVEDLIIHGSYGDFTFTNFSDIEITILMSYDYSKQSFQKSRKVKKIVNKIINKFILFIDPLQHHGAFFLDQKQIREYDENHLPLCAYQNAWSIDGKNIEFKIDQSISACSAKSLNKLILTIGALNNLDNRFFHNGKGCYSIKRVISNFLMIPVYFYQAKGLAVSKANAISLVKKEYPGFFQDSLNKASEIRNTWPITPDWVRRVRSLIVSDCIPQGRVDVRMVNLYQDKIIKDRFHDDFAPALRFFLENSKELFHANC